MIRKNHNYFKYKKQIKFKKITKIIFSTIILTTLITPVYSQTNISYEIKGFCKNQPIEINFYNSSQFKDRKKIKKELCIDRQTPKEDNCLEFDEIKLEAKLYNGHSDYFDLTKSFYLSENKIEYTFKESKDYLLEIIPYDKNIPEFEIIIPIEECKIYNDKLKQIEIEKELEKKENEKYKDLNFKNKSEIINKKPTEKNLTQQEKILKENPEFILRNFQLTQSAKLNPGLTKFDKIRIVGLMLIFLTVLFRLYKIKKELKK